MRQLKIGNSITIRDWRSLDLYLQEIGREELLTPDEEVELSRRTREGDEDAMDKLIRSNLRFVVSVAKQYQNQGIPLPDLIDEGNIGLIKAARKFDETRGFKFISYAVWWIRQSILQAIADQSRIVRLPLNQVGSLNKINKMISQFEQDHQRRPSPEELAELLDMSAEKIGDTLMVSGRHVSVDAPIADGEDSTILDTMTAEDAPDTDDGLILESLRREIDRVLSHLDPRQQEIIRMSYGLGCNEMSLDEIADKFDLTRERVRQIRETAIKNLKRPSSNLLKNYLG